MQYIIGIDIGTTNTKAVAFTDGGGVLGSAGASYPVFTDPSGRHELDPEALWEPVVSVLREILKTTEQKGLQGTAFSCAMHSLIAVDGQGLPLTRAMTWADLRPSVCTPMLAGKEEAHRIYRQTGTPIHPMSPLFKLLWLRTEEP